MNDKLLKFKKQRNIHLALFLCFLILGIASILIFALLSNYKIETPMKIASASISLVFAILSSFWCVYFYLPLKNLTLFYSSLSGISIRSVEITKIESIGSKVLRKGLPFYIVKMEGIEYALSPDLDVSSLENAKRLVVKGTFIVEIEHE